VSTKAKPSAGASAPRLGRVAALAAAGEARVPELIAMLADQSWVVRRDVIAALAALGDPPLSALCDSLRTERSDETQIAATVDTLVASMGKADAAVIALSNDTNPAVLADVAQILGRRRNPGAVATLIALTEHVDDNVAVAAIEALGRIGGRAAVEALVRSIETQHFFRVFPAIDVLGRSGDPRAVPPLVGLLKDPRYALEAARALGRTADRAAVPALCGLLASASDSQVRVAALALDELLQVHSERYGLSIEELLTTSASEASVRRVAQCLNGADVAERVALCRMLGAFRDRSAQPALVRMLDAQQEVARAATEALQQIGHEADGAIADALAREGSARRLALLPLVAHSSALPAIVDCLSDLDASVRAQACEALMRIGDASIVSSLFVLLEDENARVVHAAAAAIQALGSTETETLLLKAAESENLNVRRAAVRMLAAFGFESAFSIFCASLDHSDVRIRESAISGLALLERAEAHTLLLATARHPDAKLRAAAMRALGQSAALTPQARQVLLEGLDDAEAWVRYYACQALGRLRADDSAEAIARLIHDEAGQVRVSAIEGLSHLRGECALSALREAARAADVDLVRAALLGLSIARDESSLSLILSACAHADAATRLVAVSAAATFARAEVLDMLTCALRDDDESVRTAALGFLAGRPEREASQRLIEALPKLGKSPGLLRALSTPTPTRVPALLLALEDADEELAPLLTSSLSRLQSEDATSALFMALRLPNAAARKAAVTTLAASGSRDALTAIAGLANDDIDLEVRRICALSLAQ
jgi:HEAT repeat protein